MFLAIVAASAATTDWESISPLLPSHSDKLPVVPDRASAEQLFGGINLGGGSPFAAFTIGSGSTTSLTNSRLDVADLEIPLQLGQRRWSLAQGMFAPLMTRAVPARASAAAFQPAASPAWV